MSNWHILKKKEEEYLKEVKPYIDKEILKKIKGDTLDILLLHLRNYLNYYKEINSYLYKFVVPFSLENITPSAEKWLKKEGTIQIISSFKKEISSIPDWEIQKSQKIDTTTKIKNIIQQTGKNIGIQGKLFFMPLRSAITGETEGIELPIVIYIIGKEEVENRLRTIKDYIIAS